MENLMKQMSGRFSGAGQGKTEGSSSTRNQRMPTQKSPSFKGEKRTQNWFQRTFSDKMMSLKDDSNHRPEQVLAVAAATYVINSTPEPSIQDQKNTSSGLEPNLIRDKSRKEDKSFSKLKPGTISERFPGDDARKGSEPSIQDQKNTSSGLEPSLIRGKSRKEDKSFSELKPGTISERFPGDDARKGSGSAESKVAVIDGTDEKEIKPAPSFKKSLTFADHLGGTSITKQRSSSRPDMLSSQTESATPKPDASTIKPASTAPKLNHTAIKPETAARRPEEPPTIKPVLPEIEAKRQSVEKPETGKPKAEASENDEMTKIKERYKKLNSTILAWEEKKKKKAKNKLNRAESELERKRARALLKFKNEMDHIKQAADGARAQAEANQRNEELKAKEKVDITRRKGEAPRTCF